MKKLTTGILMIFALCVMVFATGCDEEQPEYTVFVWLTQEVIDSGKHYTIDDFSELNLYSCQTEYVTENGNSVTSSTIEYLILTLKEPNEENAQEAVRLLNERDDVREAKKVKVPDRYDEW